jgi:hypothetical protein
MHLILETRKVGIVSIVNLTFVVDNREKIILVHTPWSRIPVYRYVLKIFCECSCQQTHAKKGALPSLSFSASFRLMPREVYAPMLRDAGKRICVSILQADDLSEDLCPKRLGNVSHS